MLCCSEYEQHGSRVLSQGDSQLLCGWLSACGLDECVLQICCEVVGYAFLCSMLYVSPRAAFYTISELHLEKADGSRSMCSIVH